MKTKPATARRSSHPPIDPATIADRMRATLLALSAALAVTVLLIGGCAEEDETCPACPASSIRLEEIYLTDDSVAIGGEVRMWALPELTNQEYVWTASAGSFQYVEDYYARWKAPDVASVVKISVVATNTDDESKVVSAPIAVETYLPRHTPTYTGAGYCGLECHSVTGHGENYDSWAASRHATTFAAVDQHAEYLPGDCAQCHTVGYGDTDARDWARHNGGFDEIPVARLEGVQCENCHGPMADVYGQVPIPEHESIGLGDSLYLAAAGAVPVGCGECHAQYESAAHAQGADYIADWSGSAHGTIPAGVDLENPTCVQCHTVRGFIARLEGGAAPSPDTSLPITCVACHDPHGSNHPGDLRRDPADDVCSQCHTDAEAGYPNEPHAPHAEILAGTGGYEGFITDPIKSTPHINVIEHGCAECHYPSGSGEASHSFAADPASCTACHPGANGTDFEWSTVRDARNEILALLLELSAELNAATPGDTLTDAYRQARFNARFVIAATGDQDPLYGVHNYKYAKQLLESSIEGFAPSE